MPTYTFNNLNYLYTIGSNTATVTGGNVTSYASSSLTVLQSFVVDNVTYTVTGVGITAFSNNWTNLTSISLPPSITTMGFYCFANCTSLASFTIPPLVTTIDERVFDGCISLTSIIIPSTVTSMLGIFNGRHGGSSTGAFINCTSLTNIVLNTYVSNFSTVFFRVNAPNLSITFNYQGIIPSDLRYHLTTTDELKSIFIGNQITTISNFAFWNCINLNNVIIPASITTIGNYAFGNCQNLNTVTFLGSIPSIGTNNFTSTTDTSFYVVDGETNTNPVTATTSLSMFTNKTQISLGSPTITNFSIPSKQYGDASFSIVDPSSNSDGVFNYTSSNTSVATVSGKTITIVGGGTSIMTGIQDSNLKNGTFYISGMVTATLIVNKLTPQVGSFVIPNKSLSDVSFSIVDPTKPNNNTSTWTYTSSDTNKATISGNVITLINTGFVAITATLSSNSIYNSLTVVRQFSISQPNVAPSAFVFMSPTVVTNIIPVIEPVGNTVVLSPTIFTSTNLETFNPSVGTSAEKRENRNILVNSLFSKFSTVNTIRIPLTAFYMPSEIDTNNITEVKVIKSTGTTFESPLLINATEFNESTALFCPIDEVGNSVILNGINAYSGYSMRITKDSGNIYSIIKTDDLGISASRIAVENDIIYYAGFKIVIGSMTGQLSDAPPNVVCFKEGSQILTINGYQPVEKLKKCDLIKTVAHGFLPIDMIGKRIIIHRASNERIKDQLYLCSPSKYSNMFDDLVITGCHSILVKDFFSDEQREKTMEHNKGRVFITDNHYRLPAFLDNRASVYEPAGTYTIYHFALENNDYYMNYGVYANGLLVETCSKRYLKEIANITLIE